MISLDCCHMTRRLHYLWGMEMESDNFCLVDRRGLVGGRDSSASVLVQAKVIERGRFDDRLSSSWMKGSLDLS